MSKEKDKDKREPLEDKSTPEPLDENLFKWAVRCFRGDEQAAFFTIHQLVGRSGNVEGSLIRKCPVGHLKVEGGVNQEALLKVCNELFEEMRDEADNMRQTRRFVIRATNSIKGGEFSQKTLTVEPSPKIQVRNGTMGRDPESDEVDPLGGDILRKRVETVLQDGRFYAEHVTAALGGIITILDNQLRNKDDQINQLFKSNMEYARMLNEAENNKLDRDLIRSEREFLLTAKRKTLGLVAGLLPDFLKKVTSDGASAPGSRSAESMAIEQVLDPEAGGLSLDERQKIFGNWTDSGERLSPGILTENQVKIIIGVLNGGDPAALDRMIADGSPDQLDEKQFMEIMGVLKGEMDKLLPLMKVLNDHKANLSKPAGALAAKA